MDTKNTSLDRLKSDFAGYFRDFAPGSAPLKWCDGILTRKVDGSATYRSTKQGPFAVTIPFTAANGVEILRKVPAIKKSWEEVYPGAFAAEDITIPPVIPPITVNPPSSGKIQWLKTKSEAMAQAKSQGKKILLLVGSKCCDGTLFMRDQACEATTPANVRGLIEQHFIPWYGGAYYAVKGCEGDPITSDWNSYAPKGMFTMPLIAVIDPNTDEKLYSTTGITPRVVEDSSQFDNQKFHDRLLQYV